jgi:hypothetical protein
MILGGFTRICVNIHHPALAASFRDVARLKRTEQGRVALGVTPRATASLFPEFSEVFYSY